MTDTPTNRRQDILIAMIGVVIVLLALNVFMGGKRTSDQPSSSPASREATSDAHVYREYRNSKEGLSLRYPSDWSPVGEGELAKLNDKFVFAVRDRKAGALLGISVQRVNAKDVSIKGISKALDKAMPKRFSGFKKIDSTTIKVKGDHSALRYEYSFVSDRRVKIREQLVIIPVVGKAYHVAAWAPDADFDAVRPAFDDIVESLVVGHSGDDF